LHYTASTSDCQEADGWSIAKIQLPGLSHAGSKTHPERQIIVPTKKPVIHQGLNQEFYFQ
jgi:hypothetical protein